PDHSGSRGGGGMMNGRTRSATLSLVMPLLVGLSAGPVAAQAEVAAWGNLEGIRTDGHLMDFETGICLQRADGSELNRTSKERQRPRYQRDGSVRRVSSSLGGISLREVVEDPAPGMARIELVVAADTQGITSSTSFCLDLPADEFAGGTAHWIDPVGPGVAQEPLAATAAGAGRSPAREARG